jgi:DNA-binding XRE family transcriptional regulator
MTEKQPTRGAQRFSEMVRPSPRRFTVAGMAKELGVSRQTVLAWCTGESKPSIDHVMQIEALTEIPSREWLAEG